MRPTLIYGRVCFFANHSNEIPSSFSARVSHSRCVFFEACAPFVPFLNTRRLSRTHLPINPLDPRRPYFPPASRWPQEPALQVPPQAENTGTGIPPGDAGASPPDSDDADSVDSAPILQGKTEKVLRRRPSVFNSPPPASTPTGWKRLEMENSVESSLSGSSPAESRSGEGGASEDDEDSTTTTGSNGDGDGDGGAA